MTAVSRIEKENVRTSAETHFKTLKTEGYVILRNQVKSSVIENIKEELKPYFEKTPNCEGLFYGFKTRRLGGILAKSKTAQKLALDPLILGIMEKCLLPFCDRFQLNLTQAIRIFPGEKEQVPHRDDEMFPWPHPGMDFMVNAMWALDSFTEENGGTRIWPKSNMASLTREPDYSGVVKSTMEPGDVLLYLGSTLHCGGKNESGDPRTGLAISYSLGWLRQAENQYLAYPPEVAKTFPKELQDLVGYRAHRPNIGWYEGQDPSVVLEGKTENLNARDLFTEEQEKKLAAFYGK